MRPVQRRSSWLLGVLGLGLGLGACQTIAGIEDRKLDPEAGHSAACRQYCSDVLSACQGKNSVYTTEEVCLGVCQHLEPGEPEEPVGNTLACRAFQATIAKAEPAENCRSAGPGGDGQCGSDCEAYCALFAEACPEDNDYPTVASCIDACAGLTDQRRFDVRTGGDHEGDTIECRLVHVSSATVTPEGHCAHAPIRPTAPWCTGAADASPTCEEYCNIALAACDGELAQYESRQQCLDVCSAFDPGTNEDELPNTVGCRRYHSFSATLAAEQHCPHAGPTGDGHCGHDGIGDDKSTSNCESYCLILAKSCPDEFDAAMGDADQCMASCIQLDEAKAESKYSVAKAKESTGLQCRVLHAARAFEDPTACASAIGGDPCVP